MPFSFALYAVLVERSMNSIVGSYQAYVTGFLIFNIYNIDTEFVVLVMQGCYIYVYLFLLLNM